MSAGELVREVLERIVTPLVEGGEVRPVRPIGERAAVEAASLVNAVALSRIDAARVRIARALMPTDHVPALSPEQFLLACVLGDLLQVANTTLAAGDKEKLLALSDATLARVGSPATIAEAVSRFATFSRVSELRREDRRLTWWAGERTFHGMEPPKRLLVLPELRGVTVTRWTVPFWDFGANGAAPETWTLVLGRFLATTPLVDLACADRKAPSFVWSESTVRLLAVPAARNLALRALRLARDPEAALGAAQRARRDVSDVAASRAIEAFLGDAAVFAEVHGAAAQCE